MATELADAETLDTTDVLDLSDTGASVEQRDVSTSPKPRRRGVWATVLLCVLCLGAIAWLVVELLQRSSSKPAGDGQAAVAAAQKQALAIMTLNYKTAKADLQRVIDGSTGTMKTQYTQSESGTASTATSTKSVSTGTVSSAGLSYPKGKSSFTGNKAEVLVVGDATVAFPKTKTNPASKVQVHYRFVFEMQKEGEVWKSAQLNFAGLPSYSQVGS
jgi:Mce-associated membrane protein